MKVGKKLLSVFLAIIMMMSSMSVCFGTFSFTASAAISDDTINQLVSALQSDTVTKAGNTDNNDGVKVTTSYGSGTGNVQNTVTIETATYAQYIELKNTMVLMDKAIKETKEWGNLKNTDDVKNPGRGCTSTYHVEVELKDSLQSSGLTITTQISNFIQYFLRSSGAILHESAESYKNSDRWGNPSRTHSKVPDSYANTVIVKTGDYKGYLSTIGAYSNCAATIELGYTYTLKMWELVYTYKDSGFFAKTHACIHNMFYQSKGGFDAPSVHTASNKTGVNTELNNHAVVINAFTSVSFDDLLEKVNDGTIDTFLSNFNTAVSNMQTYVGGATTYNKLFGSFASAVAAQKTSIQSAKDMQNFLPVVNSYKDFVAANPAYGQFTWGEGGGSNNWGTFGEKGSATHAKMEADYLTFKGYYDTLVAGGTVLDYFVNNGDIDMQYYYNFTDNYNVYYLNDSKNAADAFYNTYKDTFKDYSTEEKSVLYSQVTGFVDAIPAYRSNVRGGELQVINAIYNEGYVYLLNLQEDLKVEINPYVLYFAENAHKSFVELKTSAVWEKIAEADENRSGLNAFYNTLTSARRDQLLGQIQQDANHMIAGLYQLLANRFSAEVDTAYALYTELGKPSSVTVETFLKLNAVLLAIETSIMTDLDGRNQGGYITSATRAKYDEMKFSIIPVCDAFRTTYGFNKYQQTHIADKDTGVYPEYRDLYENDEVKNSPYYVDKTKMNELINALDTILTSDLAGDLLGGLLGAEEGEDFNLGEALTDLIKGALFTDDFINTVVQLLYPLVLGEFEKVFADLPGTVDVKDPIEITVDVFYEKTLWDVLNLTGFELYPNLMAKTLDSKYQANIDKLNAAKMNWESVAIRDPETEKLTLEWGVAEQKEKLDAGEITMEEFEQFFYDAFADATEGIKPLLTALITNMPWAPVNVSRIAYAEKSISIIATIQLQVDLQLGATANRGYANLLVPIYEALGLTSADYTSVSSIEGKDDIAWVLEQILAPVFTFLGRLGNAPIDTILGILPNLIYSTAFNMIPSLLNMLQTVVTYQANEVSLGVGTVLNGGADVYVGDMLVKEEDGALLKPSMLAGGLVSLLDSFGISIPTIDQATLATLGKLEKKNTQRGAYIYSGLEGTGKAYFIEADKADVGYYLLTYILSTVKNEQAFTDLLGGFITVKGEDGQPIKDADGKTTPDYEAIAKLKETVYNDEGLNLDAIDVGDAIAAIVELANQVEYGIDPYYWYAGENNSPLGSAAADIYLNPENDWTEDKAQYLYDNLEALLGSIFTMAKLDLDKTTPEVDGSIEATLGGLINGLFTNKTVTALAKLLGSLSDLNALLAPKAEGEDAPEASEPETVAEDESAAPAIDINKLIKDELGIDLSVYAQYANIAEDEEIDFGVTDAATFVAALTELLAPVKPLLDFILGGKDLTLIDSAITLKGYKGYDNAIIPLLEALGATPAAYTEGADTLALTLNALVGVINKITTNDPAVEKDGAIYTIIDMLPGILFYISSNGLSQGVDKLLTPVYALLDTIRPIFDLSLADMIAGIEVGEEGNKKPLGLNIKQLTWHNIIALVEELALKDVDLGTLLTDLVQVIYDICDDIAVDYTSASTLESTWKKGAYNKNFSQADMLTVILSFVLDWATKGDNAEKLDTLLGTNGIIASLGSVFADVEITYGTPNWMYWFESEEAFNEYLAGGANLPLTLDALDWEAIEGNNEWDLETAKYFAEHIDELVDTVIAMINKDKADAPKNLSELLAGLVNGLVNADMLNDLVGMITGLLGDIDENLINTAGYLLDVDLAGLKAYTCTAEINSISDFINELANVLDKYAKGLINWLFFGDDYRFAKKSDKTDTIVINGGLGYEKGLVMVLEALGADLPAEANTKSVLAALAARVEAILANPVDEVLGLLPNLVYFLNANGAGVAVSNILQPVYALLEKLSAFGLNVNINDLIGIDLANLSLANIVEIVEGATDLSLDAAEEILVGFCTGKITKGQYIYRMDANKEDVVTILLVVALELISDDEFAAKLTEMTGIDFAAVVNTVFADVPVEYATPDWSYPLADNGTVDAMKYSITYPNNWTKATAQYVADNLPEIGDLIAGLVDENAESLSALLTGMLDGKVFTAANLQAIVDLITNLLEGIDDGLLEAAGVLLDVDVAGLKKYEASAEIDTVDEFAAELAKVLNTYAKGVVEWLLLGRDYKFFVKEINEETKLPVEYITINGAHGYAEGLALLLEALGCENLPAADGETEAVVTGVLNSVAALVNKILGAPVETVVEILPNIFYFLNTNGVAAVVDNTLAAVTNLLTKLEVFGLNVNINELVNLKSLMGLDDTDAAISLDNLSMAAVLEAVGLMVGLDLTLIKDVLVGFALGQVNGYESVSYKDAFKMTYADEFDKADMVTVLVNLVVLTLTDKANAEFVKGLVGEDVYGVICKICLDGVLPTAMMDFKWQFTDKADTGETFSAFESSELYEGYSFGPLYTKEMADYIADNFGMFVNNILYLLGLKINGVTVDNLTDLINGLLNGSLYNSKNVIAIRDALAGVLDSISGLEVNGKNVGKYIAAVLENSDIAYVSKVAKVNVPEFSENREMFVEYLCDVIEPLYPILKWVLAEGEFNFFVDLEKKDFIRLQGAEGYAYGIIPLLETLECKNILTPNEYYAAVEADGSVLLTSILNPLLNRVDEIVAEDPASEILSMLPNIIYFINSNGVDTVIKNTLNAVFALLSAIEPIAKIDLYEMLGIEFIEELNFEKLFQMLLDLIADATGYEFKNLDASAINELTVGTLVSYTSANGNTAYKMKYNSELSKSEMVTVILRLLVTFIMHENNREMLIGLLKDNLGMSADAEDYLRGVLDSIASLATDTYLGMDQALAVIYYLFYSVDIGAGELVTGMKDINKEWQNILKELGKSDNPEEITIGNFIAEYIDKYLDDVITSEGIAPNGFIAFFQRIIDWFNKIIEWFKNLFR